MACIEQRTIIEHRPDEHCDACGAMLPEAQAIEARQIIDIPPIVLEATEHRLFEAQCRCGKICSAWWPPYVESRVQYGPRLRALAVHLTQHHMLPFERCSSILEDLCGVSILIATLQHACLKVAAEIQPIVDDIADALSHATVAHADETGLRVAKRLHGIHTVCTPTLTYMHCHPKRGFEAMKAGGVLTRFRGILIHDCWKQYWLLKCEHALCNAHLLRELKALHEDYNQVWAGKLSTIMLEALNELHASEHGLSHERLKHYQHRASIHLGYDMRDNPEFLGKNGKHKGKQSIVTNFLYRFRKLRDEIGRFASNAHVAFTNNLAEQAIRMPVNAG